MPRHAGKRRRAATGAARPAGKHAGSAAVRGHQHQARLGERRQRLASEAARLIAEDGLADYRRAVAKAARRLGISDEASQPTAVEVEQALLEHQRLFQPDAAGRVDALRDAALQALEFFHPFQPRVTGAAVDGVAGAATPVTLHLHCDEPEAVARFLQQNRIPAEAGQVRLRLDRLHDGEFPSWHFSADGIGFDLVVLPLSRLRQAPLSDATGKPMHRASASQLARLREPFAGGAG